MHPIERLRYVARASGSSQRALVAETAGALASFSGDPQALVTACRRVVMRQPWAGSLVWFCARVLSAGEPADELWEASGEIQADATASCAGRELPDEATITVLGWPETIAEGLARRGDLEVLVVDVMDEAGGLVEGLVARDVDATEVPVWSLGRAVASSDLVVIEPTAAGSEGLLAPSGALAAASVARQHGVSVWLAVPVGRVLPDALFAQVRDRVLRGGVDDELELVPAGLVDVAVGPTGVVPVAEALTEPRCPVVPELFAGEVF